MSAMQPTPDEVLSALDPEQREVASTLEGPMSVLAGAGTGKTRAITHRIAYGVLAGVYQPQQVLAVTFTARAAGEMRARLRDLGVDGVQARTFHAAALRQLQFFWPRIVGGQLPSLVDHKAQLVAQAASSMKIQVDKATVRDLSAEIEWAKVSMLTADRYPAALVGARRRPPTGFDARTVASVLTAYERVKHARGVIDFEDVLLLLVGILEDTPDVAADVRRQYRHLVVDEYQDVSDLQRRLLDAWLGERDELCVVGDAAQTIYSFAGASPRHLLDFTTRFPHAHVVKLVRDYRSTPQVVSLANDVLDRAKTPPRGRITLISQRGEGPSPTFTEYGNDVEEAHGVADLIRGGIAAGIPPQEIAVLFRTNGQSEALEQALAERAIPYLVRGGERFFARAEVRKAMVLLRGSVRSDDGSTPLGDSARDVLTAAGWSPQAPETGGAVRDRWESLQAIATLADQLAATMEDARLGDLLAELDQRAAAQHAPTVAGVTLATLHAAKGLEWNMVALVGLSDGLLPITFADTDDAIEEERRLLYVGITRARERLILSWAISRAVGGRANRSPSRFLDGLTAASAAASTDQRARLRSRKKGLLHRTCRTCGAGLTTAAGRKTGRCSSCPPGYDLVLFESLRAWRKDTATAAKMPAFVVFTDSTLQLIAERRPADTATLATISGVGAAKLDRYAEDVLALVAQRQEKPVAPPESIA